MRLRDEMPARVMLERVLRGAALALLAVLLLEALRPEPAPRPHVTGDSGLMQAMREVILAGSRSGLALRLESVPTREERAWLAAVARAHVPVRWESRAIAPAALSVEPAADPRGGAEVQLWRSGEMPALLRDGAGELAREGGGSGSSVLLVRSVHRDVRARLAGQEPAAAARDSVILRRALVLGRAGWEARFLLRALEELGWTADANLTVAPGAEVNQGARARIDTSRYSVVVAVDSTAAARGGELTQFVRAGGGLVLVGDSPRAPVLRRLAPGAAGRRDGTGDDEPLPADDPLAGLALYRVEAATPDAVVLQRRAGRVAVAARRIDAGRVVQVGYDKSWRLRMEAGDADGDLHREWWARILSAAAYAPTVRVEQAGALHDPAPLAAMVDALGPPSAPTAPPDGAPRIPGLPLFIGALVMLLAEWASRRMRGAA